MRMIENDWEFWEKVEWKICSFNQQTFKGTNCVHVGL